MTLSAGVQVIVYQQKAERYGAYNRARSRSKATAEKRPDRRGREKGIPEELQTRNSEDIRILATGQ